MTRSILIAAVLVVACRGNDATPIDSRVVGPMDGSGSGSAGSDACTSYTTTTIAAMRQQTHTGCFEFDNVVVTGVSSSGTNPQLFVEDSGGSAFSAMKTVCEGGMTAAHPCSTVSAVTGAKLGDSVTVKGTYIKTASTTFEEFYVDNVTHNATGTPIPAATATLADIERGGSNAGLRFQYVSVEVSAGDELLMYDFSPSEFADTSAASCPYETAFGMIPKSAGVAATTMGCTNNTAQPAGVTTPNPAEILFATDFYKSFEVETDCKCAKTPSVEPVVGSTFQGTLKGMLVFDVPFNGTTGYYYLDPTIATDAPITGTVTPVM